MARHFTMRPEQLPIPEDTRPHSSWPPLMLDMAAHIGAYATLCIVDAFAGQYIYIPIDAARSPFEEIIGREKAAVLAHVYGRERLPIPTGRHALTRARRAGVIALVRSNRMTVSEAAARLRMHVRHLSTLINQTDEGTDAEPAIRTHLKRCKPGRKRQRADIYCEAWAMAVYSKVEALMPAVHPNPLADQYIAHRFGNDLAEIDVRNASTKGGRIDMDYWRGHDDGRSIDLAQGVGGGARPLMLA